MTWDNHGNGKDKWNYDHIIPISLFDVKDKRHQRALLHYTNLQPLWHRDNVIKNDRLPDGRLVRFLTPEEKTQALIDLGFSYLFETLTLDTPSLVQPGVAVASLNSLQQLTGETSEDQHLAPEHRVIVVDGLLDQVPIQRLQDVGSSPITDVG